MAAKPRARKPDLQAFFASLPTVRLGQNGYFSEHRFRDFRAVFLGSDEGKRVMAQIVALCVGPVEMEMDVQSHATLAYRAGMRRVEREITRWINELPRPMPERAQQERTEN